MKIKNDPSGIEFNLVQSKNTWNIPVLANGNNKIGQNDIQYADEDGITPILNAVEIDWNGGRFNNINLPGILSYGGDINDFSYGANIVNTTGQLLSVIDHLQKEIDNIKDAIDEIKNN